MNIYLISQTDVSGYDTYDSAVVVARSEEAARNIDPGSGETLKTDNFGTWTSDPNKVTAKLLGKAAVGVEPGVVCASFNAG